MQTTVLVIKIVYTGHVFMKNYLKMKIEDFSIIRRALVIKQWSDNAHT